MSRSLAQYPAIDWQSVHIIVWDAFISSLFTCINHIASWVAGDNVLGLPGHRPLGAAWWSEVPLPAQAHTLERHGFVTYVPDANGNGHLAWGLLDILGESICEGLEHLFPFPGGE